MRVIIGAVLFAAMIVTACGNTTYKTTTIDLFSHNFSDNQRTSTDVNTESAGDNGENILVLIGIGAGIVGGLAYGLGRASEADAMEKAMRGE